MEQQQDRIGWARKLLRLVDVREPEVRWALAAVLPLELLLAFLSVHANFPAYRDEVCALTQCVIAGLIGLLGVAISGIAIVIALFTAEQIQTMDELLPHAFDRVLYDFKWFALVAAAETPLFTALLFLLRSPLPTAPAAPFYLASFLLLYGVFYLLFYGCALIGNFIKLARIKRTLDAAGPRKRDISVSAAELQLDYLTARLLRGDKEAARRFYGEFIRYAEQSGGNEEVISYLKERYGDL